MGEHSNKMLMRMQGQKERPMIHRFSTRLRSLGKACSDFGTYFTALNHKCFKSGRKEDCEGGPTFDEARKDYRDAVRFRL